MAGSEAGWGAAAGRRVLQRRADTRRQVVRRPRSSLQGCAAAGGSPASSCPQRPTSSRAQCLGSMQGSTNAAGSPNRAPPSGSWQRRHAEAPPHLPRAETHACPHPGQHQGRPQAPSRRLQNAARVKGGGAGVLTYQAHSAGLFAAPAWLWAPPGTCTPPKRPSKGLLRQPGRGARPIGWGVMWGGAMCSGAAAEHAAVPGRC